MSLTRPTLFQDWLQRREKWETTVDPQGAGYRDTQIRILDYFIKRYVDDPRAQTPALFPLKTGLVMNQRATLVHTHLLGRPTTQTMEDATSRMSPILQRMAAQEAQKSAQSPGGSSTAACSNFMNSIAEVAKWNWSFNIGTKESLSVSRAWDCLEKSPILPDDLARYLCTILYDRRVTPILKRCQNEIVVAYCANVWLASENVAAAEAVLIEPHHQPAGVKIFREKLANPDPVVRRRSLRMIGMIGTLDDIALLMDLHALPPQFDESPIEREQILAAIASITHRMENTSTPESTGIQALFR